MKLTKIYESKTLSDKGMKALKESVKVLKESSSDEEMARTIFDVLGHIYNDDFYDLFKNIVERTLANIDETTDTSDLYDVVWQSMDEGMIYTADQWTMLQEYCEPQKADFDEAWSSMSSDVERVVQALLNKDQNVTESLNEDVNTSSLVEFIRKALNNLKENESATYYYRLGNGLYYVMGIDDAENFDKEDLGNCALSEGGNVIVGKIAVNCDDLQCDYDIDWVMPYYENGEVVDTETIFENNEDIEAKAQEILTDYNVIKGFNIESDGKIVDAVVEDLEPIQPSLDKAMKGFIDAEKKNKGKLSPKAQEIEKEIDNKPLQEMMVEIDDEDALTLLMNRLKAWTDDDIATDLYEQMYESYISGGVFDGGDFNVMTIVDNDWVNWCEVVGPGDENYEELVRLFEENGTGDVSTEDVGFGYIEAETERDGKHYFLCRW